MFMQFYPAGFLIVMAKHPHRYASFYRGVDRYPYQLPYPIPEDVPDEVVDLYTRDETESGFLAHLSVAKSICTFLHSTSDDEYVILKCAVNRTTHVPADAHDKDCRFLGYDVAYWGGDFFSMILNGLFWKQIPQLANFREALNENGLFDSAEVAYAYQGAYLNLPDTEHQGDYCIYKLEEYE
jgi:hypothetical protein